MKKFITFLLLVSSGLSVMAQSEPKTKKETLTDSAQLVYTLASDGKTKDGLYYVKNTRNENVWMQGKYKMGERSGTWYFFDAQNKMTMRYNYDQKKLVYLDTAALSNISVEVKSDDPIVVKNASIPIPLCSVDQLVNMATSKVEFNQAGAEVATEIIAHVDANGKATYTVAYKINNKVEKSKINIDKDDFKVEWLPSNYNGKAVEADFIISAIIKPNEATQYRRFRWNEE